MVRECSIFNNWGRGGFGWGRGVKNVDPLTGEEARDFNPSRAGVKKVAKSHRLYQPL